MAKVCQVTGKGPKVGNKVSHSNIKTKKRMLPNLQWHSFWLPNQKRRISLRVSAKGLKLINRRGIDNVLAELRARGECL